MSHFDLLASGYISIDHIIKLKDVAKTGKTALIERGSDVGPYYGGCGVNVSVLLASLGYKSVPLIRVGDDFSSSGFKSYLGNAGVMLDGVEHIIEEMTSYSYLVEDKNGDHMTFFYPGAMDAFYAKTPKRNLFPFARYVLMTVASQKDNALFLKKAKHHGNKLVFGMKADYDAFPKHFLKSILDHASIVFMNEREAEDVKAMFDLSDLKALFKDTKLETLIVTLGSQGSRYYHKENADIKEGHVDAVPAKQVKDTSGSGDGFIAGFMHGLFTDKPIETCLKYGSLMASIIIEKQGCTTNRPSYDTFHKLFSDQFSEEAPS